MSRREDSFSVFIWRSILFHLSVVLILTVKVVFFSSEPPISQQSVRIDVVALPEKDQAAVPTVAPTPAPVAEAPKPSKPPEAEKPQPKPKPKPEPKKVFSEKKAPKPAPKKDVKEEQSSALARLRARQKILDRLKAKEAETNQNSDFKGNQLSKGNSRSGLELLRDRAYIDDLDAHIRPHWNLPEWLANGDYKASVILRIDKRGTIIDKKFVTRSGNELFDQQVMGTLEKANPLPPPPSEDVSYYANTGIEIRFPD